MLPFYVRLTVIKKIKENNVGNGMEKKENPCTLLVGMQSGTVIMVPAISRIVAPSVQCF